MKRREFPSLNEIHRLPRHRNVRNSRAAIPRRIHRPIFESLEARIAPAIINWINPAGGEWDAAANWQGSVLPGPDDEAMIEEPGGVTITHSSSNADTVGSILATDPITLSGGTLDVSGTMSDSSAVTLSGGMLESASVQSGTTINVSGGPGSTGTLENITLAGTLNVNNWNVVVGGSGLTLANGTINISDRYLEFSGTQTLGVASGDTGNVTMTNSSSEIEVTSSTGLLTTGKGVTISGQGTITSGTANLDNQGTIDSSGTGTNGLTLTGNWNNDGLVESTSGEMTLSGTWTNNADGQLVDTASILNLFGTWNNAGSLTSSGAASVNLGGNFTLANLGTYTRDATGAISMISRERSRSPARR